MIIVGVMCAVLWGIGTVMGAPTRARWTMIGVLLAAVIIAQLTLPDGHPVRQATGEDVRLWLLIIGLAGIVMGYRKILRRIRAKAISNGKMTEPTTDNFNATELDRYARHIILREIGGPGQKKLRNAKVLVVGAGGLGSPALQYLAAAGVGTIGIIDDDVVENANLQRQVIHTDAAIGSPKVMSAADAMTAQNPHITVRPYHRKLNESIAVDLFDDYDLILDGTDNFETRYLVNASAVKCEKPLISAALTQWEGQISVFDPTQGTPCYSCVFPTRPDPSLVPSCAVAGVIGPLPGVIGSMMAVEAVKEIVGAGETLKGRMMIYDALYSDSRTIKVKPDPQCSVCRGVGLSNNDN